MNQEIQGLSKQQIKSRETRAKIFQAAKRILQKQGYELVTVSELVEAKHGETPQKGKIYGYSYFK